MEKDIIVIIVITPAVGERINFIENFDEIKFVVQMQSV